MTMILFIAPSADDFDTRDAPSNQERTGRIRIRRRRLYLTGLLMGLASSAAAAGATSTTSPDTVPEVRAGTPAEEAPGNPPAPRGGADGAETLEAILGEVADPLAQIERQIEAQEYSYAVRWLEQRVDEIVDSSHRFDGRLVRPLVLLGDAHAGLGEYAKALDQYRRAIHLSRVNSGLNAPEQVEIVYREANTLKALGDYDQANDREEYAYHVLTRSHAPTDEDLLPGIYHLARWYEKTSNVFAARALYEQALEIIEANDKQGTLEAVPALRGVAASYRMERFPPYYVQDLPQPTTNLVDASVQNESSITVNNFPAGEEALQKVVKIHRAQESPDPAEVAEAVLDLADWYTLFGKRDRAQKLYDHAWSLMAEVDSVDVAGYFAEPRLLYFPAPGDPSPPPVEERGEPMTGYVELAFDVTEDGYVRSLQTVASEPPGLMDFRVRKSMRLARYRPVLVDGVPISTEQHTFRHEFPYYLEREEQAGPSRATATAARSR